MGSIKNKTILKTLIIVFVFFICMLFFPKNAHAAITINGIVDINNSGNISGSTKSVSLNNWNDNKIRYFYNGHGLSTGVFSANNNLYCVQAGARLFENYEYSPFLRFANVTVNEDKTIHIEKYKYTAKKVSNGSGNFWYWKNWQGAYSPKKDYTISYTETKVGNYDLSAKSKEEIWKEIQGYLYIMSTTDSSRASGGIATAINNKKQLAAWAYINLQMSEDARNYLNIPDQSSQISGLSSKYIKVKTNSVSGSSIVSETYGGNTSDGQAAYTIYENALKVKEGETNKVYYGSIYLFKSATDYIGGAKQRLAMAEISSKTITETNKFEIKLRKVDSTSTSTKLPGAVLKVRIVQENAGNKFTLYNNKITTTSSDTTIKLEDKIDKDSIIHVTVEETKTPNDRTVGLRTYRYLELEGKVTFDFKFDTKSNTWKRTGITPGGMDSTMYSENSGTITIKNKSTTITTETEIGLKIVKKDSDTNEKLSGAEFTIEIKDVNGNTVKKVTDKEVNSNGVLTISKFNIDNPEEKTPLTITITETKEPQGYKKLANSGTIKVNYSGGKWVPQNPSDSIFMEIADGKKVKVEDGFIKAYIGNKREIPEVSLQITKFRHWINSEDEDSYSRLNGAKFDITFTQDGKELAKFTGLESSAIITEEKTYNGMIVTPTVQPLTKSNIEVLVHESYKPDGYEDLKDIKLTYVFSDEKWTCNIDNTEGLRPIEEGIYTKGSNDKIKIWVVNEYIPYLKLEALKVDEDNNPITDGKIVFDVKFEQDGNTIYDNAGVSLDDNGYLKIKNVRPLSKNEITVTIEETETSCYFMEEGQNPIKLKFRFSEESREWNLVDKGTFNGSLSQDVSETGKTTIMSFKIQNTRIPKISINGGIQKFERTKEEHAIPAVGTKFTATFEQNGSDTEVFKGETDDEGNVEFLFDFADPIDGEYKPAWYQPTNINNPVKVTIHEEEHEDYIEIEDRVYIFEYNKTAKQWELKNNYIEGTKTVVDDDTCYFENLDDIVNIVEVVSFTINKQDPRFKNNNMDGAEFEITLKNVKKINGQDYTGSIRRTVSGGKIELNNLEVEYSDEDVIIELVEKTPPPATSEYYYNPIDGKIVITLERETDEEGNNYEISDIEYEESGYTNPYVVEDETIFNNQNNTCSILLNNIALIRINGRVWIDGQKGVKNVQAPNGYIDTNEKGLKGVRTALYSYEQENYYFKNDEEENPEYDVETDESGNYTFKDIEKTEAGYQIRFEYNGIWFNPVGIKGDSKAEENSNERNEFNDRFKTVTYEGSNDETPLGYEYSTEGKNTENERGIAKLIGEVNGENPSAYDEEEGQFKIMSYSDTITTIKENNNNQRNGINCGLLEKFFDLRLDMVINNATLEINGKKTEYNYDKIEQIADSTPLKHATDIEKTVDLKLYDSDYRYRIDDYKYIGGENIQGELEEDYNGTDENMSENQEITEDKEFFNNYEFNIDDQLRVFVTYEVAIMNQSDVNSKVEELAYYYDENYEFVPERSSAGIRFEEDDELPQIDGKIAARVSNFGQYLNYNNDYRQTLYFTFEIIRDNGELPIDIEDDGLECANIVEILSYSTEEGGFIDNDSCPGDIDDYEQDTWEDDTYGAKSLRVSLEGERKRIIEGTVWEDLNKNGFLEDGENAVNGVTVQLVEVREINGKLREAIWQETISGTNYVKTRNNINGEQDGYYDNENTETGKYIFTDFIPGNYIVRFIYGDGLYRIYNYDTDTWELVEEDGIEDFEIDDTDEYVANIKKYNGQDYQSTKNTNYQAQNYTNKLNNNRQSVAVDNEARRLDVMAYSSTIDGGIGEAFSIINTNSDDLEEKLYDDDDLENVAEIERLKEYAKNQYIKKGMDETAAQEQVEVMDIEELIKFAQNTTLENTWMCAETPIISINVDDPDANNAKSDSKIIIAKSNNPSIEVFEGKDVKFENLNFGLMKRPETKLELQKHITALKIQPTGVGIQPIVDAKLDISNLFDDNNSNNTETNGINGKLSIWTSTRDERGMWKVESDLEEIIQGAGLEVEYTYVIMDRSEPDYLSETLVNTFINEHDNYSEKLVELAKNTRQNTKTKNHAIGTYLGDFYYTQTAIENEDWINKHAVPSRVETMQDYINNSLKFDDNERKSTYSGGDFSIKDKHRDVDDEEIPWIMNYYNQGGRKVENGKEVNIVIVNTRESNFLTTGTLDYGKKALLTRTLDVNEMRTQEGITIPTYLGEITKFTNAAGRRDMSASPENLKYVHSEDINKILNAKYVEEDGSITYYWYRNEVIYELNSLNDINWKQSSKTEIPEGAKLLNEIDEFWGESISVTKPTGEDRSFPYVYIIALSSVTLLAVGIALIKRKINKV